MRRAWPWLRIAGSALGAGGVVFWLFYPGAVWLLFVLTLLTTTGLAPIRFKPPGPAPHPLDDFEVPGISAPNLRTWYDDARQRFEADADDATAEFERALDHIFHARGPIDFQGRIMEGEYEPNGAGFRRVERCETCGARDDARRPGCPTCKEWLTTKVDTMGRPIIEARAGEVEAIQRQFQALYSVPGHHVGPLVVSGAMTVCEARERIQSEIVAADNEVLY